MKLSEAFKLLEEGVRICNQTNLIQVYQKYKDLLLVFYKGNDYYILNEEDDLSINFPTMFDGWYEVKEPLPLRFKDVMAFYKDGMPIRRMSSSKIYQIKGLAHTSFNIEDIEACDWIVTFFN